MLAKINKIQHKRSGNFFLLAGPCAIESEEMAIANCRENPCDNQQIGNPVHL